MLGVVEMKFAQCNTHYTRVVGMFPCNPKAEGHGDSVPQGALKVALSGTLEKACKPIGMRMALDRHIDRL